MYKNVDNIDIILPASGKYCCISKLGHMNQNCKANHMGNSTFLKIAFTKKKKSTLKGEKNFFKNFIAFEIFAEMWVFKDQICSRPL